MTIMKKTIICLLCLAATLNVRGADDDDRPVRIDQMPQTAQTFIARHFNGVKVALAKMEKDFFGRSYEVIFTNGNKVEFDGNGRWTEIECKYTEVPASAIPEAILRYVGENYPGQKVWKLEYDDEESRYEVKLSGRWELEFDLEGRLTDLDRD